MGRLAPAQRPQFSPSPVRGTWDIRAVSAPEGHFLETLKEEGPVGDLLLPKMERQPWYPIFTASDGDNFREQNGHRVVSQEEVRFEVTGDEYLDLGVENLKARNVSGTMDPLGDGRKWTLKSIKERTEQWSPPPDRDSKLEVVRSGSLYDIRAYKGETRPTRLFGEDDEEMRYKIPPEDAVPEKTKELEEERQEIVRSQVVRKSHTVAERWTSLEELENINATAPEGKGSYSTGFAICFDRPASDRVRTPVDPNGIDTEQINFAAARQQFLLLEKANPKLLLGPEKWGPSSRGRSGWSSPVAGSEGYNQVGPGGLKERSHLLSFQGGVTRARDGDVPPSRPWSVEETSHSFRSITLEEKASEKMPDHPLGSTVAIRDAAEMQLETPIEREIRLSMEREADLWKERGIRRVSSRDELVEIPSVALLSASVSSSPASSRKGGDKPRASFNVQREIEQEIKREEDLQREGRLLGTYDKGLQLQDVAERRKVFEQGMEADVPQKGREGGGEGWSLETRSSPASGSLATEDQGSTMSWRPEAREMPPSPGTTERRPADERSSYRPNFSLSSGQQRDPSRTTLLNLQEGPNAGDGLVLRQEHFAIPVRKVKFSFPETQRPEPRPEWAPRREELYTLKTWKPRTSALIDQEIREALQRELELQAQREEARLTAEKEPGSRLSSQSSAASGIAGSYSLPTSPVFVPVGPVSGSPSPSAGHVHSRRVILDADVSRDATSPTVEQEKQKRKREGGKYAGIELCDEIDSEVVKSTKAVCQRGVLAQLWETGQIHQIYGDSD